MTRLGDAFAVLADHERLLARALDAERDARRINGMPAPRSTATELAAVVESIAMLLERAADSRPPAAAREPKPPAREPKPPAREDAPGAEERRLIALRDDVRLASGRGHGARGVLDHVDAELTDLLEARGIVPFEAAGGVVDERCHQVVAIRATSDPAADGLICETVRLGYRVGDRVWRAAEVVVYRFAVDGTSGPRPGVM